MTVIRSNMKREFCLVAVLLTLALSCTKTGASPEPPAHEVSSLEAVNLECVARVIGNTPAGENLPNPNSTLKRFNMASTDYGNMWDAGNGQLWCMFGDNFNDRGGDWKSNAIAFSTDRDLTDGLYYDDMLRGSDGKRMEFIVSRAKTGQHPGDVEHETTCIPTAGVSIPHGDGNRQYVSYMSVNRWAVDGNDVWSANYSELVYTDDYGKTWVRSGVKWDGGGNFVQAAFIKDGGMLYMFGTRAGRKGRVYLARTSFDKVLDKSAWTYWDGGGWSSAEASAEPVANGTVSEMTVQYNSYYKRYIMMYLSVNQRKLVYRDAAAPEGEWSEEKIIAEDGYGPYIHPWFCDGRDLWYVASSVTPSGRGYDTWHIHLYHAELREFAGGFNMVWEGGFENDPNKPISYRTLWHGIGNSTSTRDAHGGKIACRLQNTETGVWKDACVQTICVHKNTDYVLSCWAKSSVDGSSLSYLGARLTDGRICDTNPALKSGEWTQINLEFNSRDCASLDVFFGTWGAEGLHVTVDDISLTPKRINN